MANYDLIIRQASLLDGSGAPAVNSDIAVNDDRIAAIGDLSKDTAGLEIQGRGLRATPGFIDIHTHSDISLCHNPGQASSIAMGVTTQVTGNCGLSLGLVTTHPNFEFEQRWLAPHGGIVDWNNFDGFLNRVAGDGSANNILSLVGQGTLRKRVMGLVNRQASAGELLEMRRLLAESMEAGAWGLSTGLEYPPSSYADVSELTEISRTAAVYGGIYATHLRNEGDTLIEAVEEALAIAEGAGLPLQLSHHKAEGIRNWGKIRQTLKIIEEARSRGLDVQLDQYPYTAFMTSLSIQTLPRWALNGTSEETNARLLDGVQRAKIEAEMLLTHPEWGDDSESGSWGLIQIGVCRSHPELQGRTIASLAREAHTDPIHYTLDLLIETHGYVSAVNFAINEEDIAEVLRYHWTSIGSDGVGTHPSGAAGKEKVHPRAYGTFPRVLGRYARELGIITEAQAIHKMTGLPAARLGIPERGLLRPGWFADITLYDPETIGDQASFENPHQYARGIDTVLVNGRIVFEKGIPTGTLSGKVLRHSSQRHLATPQVSEQPG